ELAAAHHGLLASKLAKKASTIHGAIHDRDRRDASGAAHLLNSLQSWPSAASVQPWNGSR
ncbi:hypothetical protein, partial [Litorisediminicola beolgyonensis]